MATATIAGKPYTILIAPRKDEELQAALDGEPVEPSETAEEIEADIKTGLYYFETSHCDLGCIDIDVQPDRIFYAMRLRQAAAAVPTVPTVPTAPVPRVTVLIVDVDAEQAAIEAEEEQAAIEAEEERYETFRLRMNDECSYRR
jgi:hypothetical protein